MSSIFYNKYCILDILQKKTIINMTIASARDFRANKWKYLGLAASGGSVK